MEDSLLATGSGSNQPHGVFGNTGTGTGTAYELTGAGTDGALLLNSLFDVTSTLKAAYQPNASWIMSRATGLAIRQSTDASEPVCPGCYRGRRRDGAHPWASPCSMTRMHRHCQRQPQRACCQFCSGTSKQGYLIGVRGGAGINVKILDQPWASAGQIGILAYRRLDARVRRSEAIQSITVSHS